MDMPLDNFTKASSSNDSTIMDDESSLMFVHGLQDYIVFALLSFFSVMGTIGNIVVICVFFRKRDRLVSTHFILVLAFVDLITCVVVIPYTLVMEYINFYIQSDMLCKIYQFFITCNIPFSALIMVAIAIDRYLCICHPFLRALNLRRAKFMTGALAILAIGLGILVALMHGVYRDMDIYKFYEMYPNAIVTGYDNDRAIGVHNNVTDAMQTSYKGYHSQADIIGNEGMFYLDVTTGGESHSNETDRSDEIIVLYSGYCETNNLIFSEAFQLYFLKAYTAMYLLCLIIVVILYSLIYQSVLARRTKRHRQKSRILHLVKTDAAGGGVGSADTLMTIANADHHSQETTLTVKAPVENCNGHSQIQDSVPPPAKNSRRKMTKRDKMRLANLRTAGMLFVVTIVFIVTFLPAFLMINYIVPYQMIIFYMYFANNVANPIIYSFMNKNFREDLTHIFNKCSLVFKSRV